MGPTTGWRAAKSVQLRPFKGSSRTVVALTVALISELESWTTDASVVTSTVLDTVPTWRARLKTASEPTLIVIPVLVAVLNPLADTDMEYAPGTRFTAE